MGTNDDLSDSDRRREPIESRAYQKEWEKHVGRLREYLQQSEFLPPRLTTEWRRELESIDYHKVSAAEQTLFCFRHKFPEVAHESRPATRLDDSVLKNIRHTHEMAPIKREIDWLYRAIKSLEAKKPGGS